MPESIGGFGQPAHERSSVLIRRQAEADLDKIKAKKNAAVESEQTLRESIRREHTEDDQALEAVAQKSREARVYQSNGRTSARSEPRHHLSARA